MRFSWVPNPKKVPTFLTKVGLLMGPWFLKSSLVRSTVELVGEVCAILICFGFLPWFGPRCIQSCSLSRSLSEGKKASMARGRARSANGRENRACSLFIALAHFTTRDGAPQHTFAYIWEFRELKSGRIGKLQHHLTLTENVRGLSQPELIRNN